MWKRMGPPVAARAATNNSNSVTSSNSMNVHHLLSSSSSSSSKIHSNVEATEHSLQYTNTHLLPHHCHVVAKHTCDSTFGLCPRLALACTDAALDWKPSLVSKCQYVACSAVCCVTDGKSKLSSVADIRLTLTVAQTPSPETSKAYQAQQLSQLLGELQPDMLQDMLRAVK